MLLMDVDGVLTDGRIFWIPFPDGTMTEAKAFDVTDGAGIAVARRAGIRTGLISRRNSPAVAKRAEELKIDFIFQGVRDKKAVLEELLGRTRLSSDQTCFIGDDIVDLPLLVRVGFPVAVANACSEVREHAAYITRAPGGAGAVREVIELIMRAQGKWDPLIAEFLQ